MSQSQQFIVQMGGFPEGYCPSSPQQLAQDIAARMLISFAQTNSSFGVGPVLPNSDSGPFFLDGTDLYVWDPSLGVYRPESTAGFSRLQKVSVSGNWTVPAHVYKIMVELWGAGGAGSDASGGTGGAGGGAGAFAMGILSVVPGQIFAVTIGTGGAAADGGDTKFSTVTAGGGKKSTGISAAGLGGAASGADFGISGQSGIPQGTGGLAQEGGSSPRGGAGGSPGVVGDETKINGVLPGGAGAGQTNGTSIAGAGANGLALIWY